MSDGPIEDIQTIRREATEGHCSKPSSDTACNNIDQFPFEVLAHVFQCYVDEDQNSACPKGAFPLGAVCKAWRDIAWTTSALWTVLHCRLRSAAIETQVQLAIAWIKRSGCLPLSITLFNGPPHLGDQELLVLPLFAVIRASFARCRCLRIIEFYMIPFLRLGPFEGPSILETLCLDAMANDMSLNLEPAAPKHIDIRGFKLSGFIVNWHNLTSFSASGMHLSEVLQVMQLVPQLTKCSYLLSRLDKPRRPSPGHQPGHVIHTNLAVLDIKQFSVFERRTIERFFQNTTLPNLTTCNVATIFAFPVLTFWNFAYRSKCPIEVFSFTDGTLAAFDIGIIAALLPSITTLTVTRNDEAEYLGRRAPRGNLNEFFRDLCMDSRYSDVTPDTPTPINDTILLPKLRSLHISTDFAVSWKYLPGWRYRRQYDNGGVETSTHCTSSLVGRPDLKKISIWRSCGRSGRCICSNLINKWATYDELMDLRASDGVKLELKVERQDGQGEDLFLNSLAHLEKRAGDDIGYDADGYAYYLDLVEYRG